MFYRDFQVFRGDAGGGVTACQEVKVASDKVDRAALFVVLCAAGFFSGVLGSLPLGSVVHFEVVKRSDGETSFCLGKSNREDSARVDFDRLFTEGLSVYFELDKYGDASFVA